MNAQTVVRIEQSFTLLAPRGDELVDRFYALLFSRNPSLSEIFPSVMKNQKKKLLASLVLVVKNIRKPESLRDALLAMGCRHTGYGCVEAQYGIVRDTLLEVMGEMAGDAWNEQLNTDWRGAIDFVSGVMIEGQRRAAVAAV